MKLKQRVIDKINALGVKEASRHFGVSTGTISNWLNGKSSPSLDAAEQVLSEDSGLAAEAIIQQSEVFQPKLWEGRKVHVLLPVYRSFSADTHYTLFANYAKYGPSRIGMTQEKGTQIHVARNILVHKGLKTDAEWLVFVDDDMILPTGDPRIINGRYGSPMPESSAGLLAFDRLLSLPPEMLITGALYFGRHRFGTAQCSLGFDQGWEIEADKLRRHQYNSPIPVRWVAPGFMRIHRSVFERMKEAIDAGQFPECKPLFEGRPYGFFTPKQEGMGEDVSFGLRAGEIGIQSYLDPVLEVLHVGECAYGGHNTMNRPPEV